MVTPLSNCTVAELITVYVSRLLRDDDVVFTGMVNGDVTALYSSRIPIAATGLARLRHAPSLTLLLAGWLVNPDLGALDVIPDSEFIAGLRDLPSEAVITEYPQTFSLQRGDVTVGFSSGAQVDVHGNVNAVCIGDHDKPAVRLVGPIFQTEHLSYFGREIVMMGHHQARNFVDRVDFISAVGAPKQGRPPGSGLEVVVTPLCVFELSMETPRLRVRHIHPGVEQATVRENTGFDVGDLSEATPTPLPTEEELRLLRDVVDRRGVLLGEHSWKRAVS